MEKMRAKKSLGQNFLEEGSLIERIIEVSGVGEADTVLEIGPGMGALTFPLLEKVKKVVAVEADERFIELFNQKKHTNLSLYQGNILDIGIERILEAEVKGEEYHVIANIPYYITAPIVRLLLSLSHQPKQIILMVQDEVAERLSAKPGGLSLLGIMAQYYAETEKLFFVPKEAFSPVPKVDSAIIRLIPYKAFDKEVDRRLFRVVKVAFQAKRKTLANNLKGAFGLTREDVESLLARRGLSLDIRAQAMSLEDWEWLSAEILALEKKEKSK
ncbi:MAG: 16S rRNA (adenine(1518)-N(6)/adenine(1519)-N(6))-dimethyltransferase RsmA [Candidatus Moranbacteria bacterium]|nr:16S rRNA (adenine(1518)-N(6)/adenine(1519)-N(6))-dimethyltransferase RsmA [Candidatus Moranbacteria bacterium]